MRSSPALVRRRYRRSPGLVFSDPTSSSRLRAVQVSEPLMSRPRWAMRLARTVASRSGLFGVVADDEPLRPGTLVTVAFPAGSHVYLLDSQVARDPRVPAGSGQRRGGFGVGVA